MKNEIEKLEQIISTKTVSEEKLSGKNTQLTEENERLKQM